MRQYLAAPASLRSPAISSSRLAGMIPFFAQHRSQDRSIQDRNVFMTLTLNSESLRIDFYL